MNKLILEAARALRAPSVVDLQHNTAKGIEDAETVIRKTKSLCAFTRQQLLQEETYVHYGTLRLGSLSVHSS